MRPPLPHTDRAGARQCAAPWPWLSPLGLGGPRAATGPLPGLSSVDRWSRKPSAPRYSRYPVRCARRQNGGDLRELSRPSTPPSSGPVVRRQGRRSASGRGLCGRLTGRLSACMVARLYCALRQPPGLSPALGVLGFGASVLRAPLGSASLAAVSGAGARPGPSSGRCSGLGSRRCWLVLPPPAALPAVRGWLAAPLCRPSLVLVVCRGRPSCGLRRGVGGIARLWPCGRRGLSPRLVSRPPPPPAVAWGSWCVNRQRLRGAQRLALARSRAPRCGQKVL